jgi:predicted ATPase/signal transduction histidine kinase
LITHPDVRHLLLVGAYRDNEVGPSHPLRRILGELAEPGAKVHEIVLAPLGLDNVGQLIADALHCEPERVRPLAELVQEKTAGNPFFSIQFLTALADEGLLVFDSVAALWGWSISRIHARNYTDNVVDFMAAKLQCLSAATQEAIKRFACLGNAAKIDMLTLVQGSTEQSMHAQLDEAVQAGLVVHDHGAYKFLHDRIHQAAYSLIPEQLRAEVHVSIGRVLRARLTADELTERLFEVANQFNRGAALLIDPIEKAGVATLNLRTGRRAKAAAAYASARVYFAAGIALLDERDWDTRHELTFALSLERAECDLLSGYLETAEQLIGELLQRTASDIEFADTSCLKINLHVLMGEHPQAVDSALASSRLLGIDLPAHPTFEQVLAEYETVWQTLGGQTLESLIDLPLMTDLRIQAALKVLSVLAGPATFTDFQLFCLLACRMVSVSIQHGMSGAAAYAFACLGSVLGANFHRYREGYRLARLACDLVEKHAFTAYDTKVYHAMGLAAFWTEPLTNVIELRRAATRTATEKGDLTFACYGMHQSITYLLMRNDPLDAVWRESAMALDFARTAKFRDVVHLIESQQRFIAIMQGRDATFSDDRIDEAAFAAQLTPARNSTVICLYWIRELKARYLSGDYSGAQVAADKAKPLLRTSAVQLQLLDYFYYTALTLAVLYEHASADDQALWHNRLAAHREQLREWAEIYPPTFSDKHSLVSGELARLDGHDAEAMRLYEHAIQSAREHGFVQTEGVAHEVAARFFAARGVESIAQTYLRSARDCYLRWGAIGKVRQLDLRHPGLREGSGASAASATVSAPVEQLDVGTVVKASQAVSSEIEMGKLIETLMRIALEHAGAERGLLILFTNDEPRIAAEASTGQGKIAVTPRNAVVTPTELIESVLYATMRTRESVILDDASIDIPSSVDEYVAQRHARSVLCLPLTRQAKLIGALYLENSLTPHVFTSAKIAVLKVLSSQAAISLENVRLYDELRLENRERRRAQEELRRSEAYLSEAQKLSQTGTFSWRPSRGEIYWTEETYRIFEFDPTVTPSSELWLSRVHPEDAGYVRQMRQRAADDERDLAYGYRLRMPDERIKYVQVVARAFRHETGEFEFVGALMDVTAIRLAERELLKARTDLAHVMRVSSLGELTASIAHEVNQPLGAVMFNAEASLSWLDGDPPNMNEAHAALERIVRDGTRAGEVIQRIRALAKKTDMNMAPFNLNDLLSEAVSFAQHELLSTRVALRTEYPSASPVVLVDKVQLQQVILNLVINGIEAMQPITDRPRELVIRSELDEGRQVRVTVKDCGVGFSADSADRLFNTFFTTKPGGMGMGLSICRSIIELHGGRIWAAPNLPHGAVLQFTLPLRPATASRV